MHFARDIPQKLSPRSIKMAPKMTKMLLPKFICFFSIFDTFWNIFEASEGSKCWGCHSWNCIFCIFTCFCKVGQKCFQKVQKTIKMITKWYESWRLRGGKKSQRMHITWDIHQKMTLPGVPKRGSKRVPKCCPKLSKQLHLHDLLVNSGHPKVAAVRSIWKKWTFSGVRRGGPKFFKINKNVQKFTYFRTS